MGMCRTGGALFRPHQAAFVHGQFLNWIGSEPQTKCDVAWCISTMYVCTTGTRKNIGDMWGVYLNVRFIINLMNLPSYLPQMNSRIERTHRTIKQILRKLTNTDAARWEEKLGPSLWSYRITPSVNGFTPYFLQYGKEPRIPRQPLHPEYDIINDATERYQQLANSFQTAARQTEEALRHNTERKT